MHQLILSYHSGCAQDLWHYTAVQLPSIPVRLAGTLGMEDAGTSQVLLPLLLLSASTYKEKWQQACCSSLMVPLALVAASHLCL